MISPFARNAIVLGLLSAIGPFAIDMYLPALPTVAADLHASTATTQITLMAFFLSFGTCQLLYGVWSDMAGRKTPLFVGIALFALGSVGCGLATGIGWLIAFRAIQGIGAAATTAIPRAIIRDLHTGYEATRLMALVMLVFSVSPILAPLFGSALIVPFGWRAVFAAVTVAALLGLVLVATTLRETRPPEQRLEASVGRVLRAFGQLFGSGRFLGLVLTSGFGMGGFFVFLATSSFVYIDHFKLTPMQYGLAFAVNAVSYIGSSQFSARAARRFGRRRTIMTATSLYALFALLLLVVVACGVDNLFVLSGMLLLVYGSLGLVIPTSTILALEDHGPIAGMAASLAGTIQILTGGLMILVSSLVFDGSIRPMVAVIAGCAVASMTTSLVTLGRPARRLQSVAP